ncbi:hypothetical protein CK203_113134 [Vitis vinifera]|uniref:Uncharacterized protein n=1 Tax=Vitis vinifera TaxID=29760 RepID=A0A438BMZ4_VITVI|nr:hypothetical protein CK203_113134 [Vitis vinifera]
MSSIETSKGILEIGKFAFYVSIPIDLMYTLANNSENMKKLVQKAKHDYESRLDMGFPKHLDFASGFTGFFEVWLDTRPVIAPNTRILPLVSRAFEIQEGTRLVYNILSCF